MAKKDDLEKGLPYCYYEYCGIDSDKIICTVVISVSIDFPSNSQWDAPFHHIT